MSNQSPIHPLVARCPRSCRYQKLARPVIWPTLALVLALATCLLSGCDGDTGKAATAPAKGNTITTAKAKEGNIGVYLDSIGTVTPVYTASITSQVTGVIVAIHYTEGQMVNQGDPLIDIDPRPFLGNLLQAQGALERDQNLLAEAKMDLDRFRAAWAKNAIAKQTLDDQEKLVLQDEGTVKNDTGAVQFDQTQVDFCHITAPIAGRVGLRLVDPGNLVQGSGNVVLVVVTQLSPITVVFTIAEDYLDQVTPRLRAKAKLKVDALDRTALTAIATGELLTVDNQIDTTTGTVKARAVFDNANDELFPNQFVNTRLLVNTLEGVTLVPSSAIQQNGDASFVYVIQNNVAYVRPVKKGVTDGGLTQVDGVQPGEVVANSSFDKLQDKTPVVIAPTTAPATTRESSKDLVSPTTATTAPTSNESGTNGSIVP